MSCRCGIFAARIIVVAILPPSYLLPHPPTADERWPPSSHLMLQADDIVWRPHVIVTITIVFAAVLVVAPPCSCSRIAPPPLPLHCWHLADVPHLDEHQSLSGTTMQCVEGGGRGGRCCWVGDGWGCATTSTCHQFFFMLVAC